jgi:hypothetical protein
VMAQCHVYLVLKAGEAVFVSLEHPQRYVFTGFISAVISSPSPSVAIFFQKNQQICEFLI